jgi:hypothetical protein
MNVEMLDAQGFIALLTAWALIFLFFGYQLGRVGKVKDILGKVWSAPEVKNAPGNSQTERIEGNDGPR